MELKSFSYNSMSTFEIAKSSSTLFSNFRHKFGVTYSNQFNCNRGLFLKSYSASDESYLTDKGVVYSVGSDDFAALTTSSNSINGSTSSLYYRNLILGAFDDEYGGVVIDPNRLPQNSYAFASMLCLSLSHWKKLGKKGIWLKLPLEKSDLVPIAVKEGFEYHHAQPGYVMLTYWIPEGPCMLPANASHQVGIGGFVINDNNEVLVVQEKHCSPATLGLWKIPTGFIHEAEEIYTGAVREVKEETGIDTDFIEVIAFRHVHNVAFEKSDLFFICMLKPLSSSITVDDHEIEAAKWMPLVEFVEQPLIQEDSMFKKIVDIFIARLGKRYCGLSTHQVVSNFDGKISSLYYNVIDNDDANCVGK
ncbi:nudix hydrolase 8-like [Vicia villosa]|uniref:nudix hydrolase 8-like n=1 Tax=Vicia villosa TaxID=3911 RepID=UPI00273C625A|nr:nudix hydrolase 8-like [Vicia villosa]XP_058757672.1 nudix hydrolase 8-like [Vicia villosa]